MVLLPAIRLEDAQDMIAHVHAREHRAAVAADFLRSLYGEDPPGYVGLTTFPDRPRTLWLPATELREAAERAAELAADHDVYLNVGLRGRDLGEHRRGTAESVIALPGLWVDVDVKDSVHKQTNLPPSQREALKILKGIPPPPTFIVDSGHGVQAWWLFRELWVFEGERERQEAQELSRRFQATLREQAGRHGWHLDATHDLARLLRLPGTSNRKREPKEVRIVWRG